MINERYRGGVLVNDYLLLGVDAPPGFRIRWGFFFVVDELKTRFFFDETSSGVGGVNIEESNRPLRRREFVGNGGTGVVDLDSAATCKRLIASQEQGCLITNLSDYCSMVPVLASAEEYPSDYLAPPLVALDMKHRAPG